jgi:mRNA interferase RelE/StbE
VAYRLVIRPPAERDLRALTPTVLARVDARIRDLADNPRPPGVERLWGPQGGFRLRVGDYRILYDVDDAQQMVMIGRVRHRRDVYRGL